jgi:dienelactone hydrolase
LAVLAIVCIADVGPTREPAPKEKKASDPPTFLDEFKAVGKIEPRLLPLFLDDFRADTAPKLLVKAVRLPSAVGHVHGYWVRPDVQELLPAVLMVHNEEAWADWMKLNARNLASVGYEVVMLNVQQRRRASAATDEATLAELSAAVRWLRGRAEVLPNRCGVVGWGWSGTQAMALASAVSLQACVVCDPLLPIDAGTIIGLRETPLLAVFAGDNQAGVPALRKSLAERQVPCKFHVAEGVRPGFMGSPGKNPYAHDAAEDAWHAIYQFLEKHVEDARPPVAAAAEDLKSVATIADIMRAVNEPSGLRGALSKALEQEPGSKKQWERIRANAALMAEAGAWLQKQAPPKGPAAHWQEEAQAFRAAAEALVSAADKRDYAAAQRGLTRLAGQCAACHAEHR